MGFFKGKPKDKDKDDKAGQSNPQKTRRSIRTIAPSGLKPAPPAPPREDGGKESARPSNPPTRPGIRPSAPAPAPVPNQRSAQTTPPPPPPSVRPQSRAPIQSSRPADFAGDLATARRSTGPARTGDAALLEFLKTKVSLLDDAQIQQVKAKSQQDGVAIDIAAVELGFISEEQMVSALTQECWVPHLKVDRYEIRKKALDTITREDAVHYGVFPVDKLGSLLTLAMVNPLDADTIRTLESKTSLDIKKVVATRSEITQVIEKYYSGAVQAKEGSLSITQDVEPKSVTQMLAGVTAASDKLPPSKSMMPAPTPIPAAIQPDIQDIDDLLSADEAIAPSLVEPLSLKAEDIEILPEPLPELTPPPRPISAPAQSDFELEDTSAIAPAASATAPPAREPQPSSLSPFEFEDELAPSPAPVAKAPPKPAPLAPEFEIEPSQPIQETGIFRPKPTPAPIVPPRPAAPAPARTPAPAPTPAARVSPPAPTSAPSASPAARTGTASVKPATSRFTSRNSAVKPGLINLVPVMEEEFQHAITHGKSHVFEKWVGLQTRNRIINAVTVENELDRLLGGLYATPRRI